MKQIKNYILVFIACFFSNIAFCLDNKLNGMVVLPSKDGFFSAFVYLGSDISKKNINVRDGYAMDYYRYGIEHSDILSYLDITYNEKKDSGYIRIKSLKPVDKDFNLVLRVRNNKEEILGLYEIKKSKNINYLPNKLNKSIDATQNKNMLIGLAVDFGLIKEELVVNKKINDKEHTRYLYKDKKHSKHYRVKKNISSNYYYVVKGDNLIKIAKKILKDNKKEYNNENLKCLADEIYNLNKNAFIKNDVNKIKEGYVLVLPCTDKIKNNIESFDVENQKHVKRRCSAKTTDKTTEKVAINYDENIKYNVCSGDCLSKIAHKIKQEQLSKNHKDICKWKKIMLALYNNNKSSFIKGDINRIKAGAVLRLKLEEIIECGSG